MGVAEYIRTYTTNVYNILKTQDATVVILIFATGKPQQSERITNKGKSKKLALIAVCNKLLKQAFAIAKSGVEYDAGYRSVLSIMR